MYQAYCIYSWGNKTFITQFLFLSVSKCTAKLRRFQSQLASEAFLKADIKMKNF